MLSGVAMSARSLEDFLVQTYANGETVRESIVKAPRRKRYPDRPYWHWNFDKTRKKGF